MFDKPSVDTLLPAHSHPIPLHTCAICLARFLFCVGLNPENPHGFCHAPAMAAQRRKQRRVGGGGGGRCGDGCSKAPRHHKATLLRAGRPNQTLLEGGPERKE